MSRARLLRYGPAALGLVLAALLAGCKQSQPTPSSAPPAAIVQGWSQSDLDAWFNGGQGSRLMPLKWFQALEQPSGAQPAASDAPKPFFDMAYLASFRILPPGPNAKARLPIGFAIDQSDDSVLVKTQLHWLGKAPKDDKVDWVGLNCAACHTAALNYGGQTFTVAGAPSLFDFQSFVEAVDQALIQTSDSANPGADGKRWDRFASQVLGKSDDNPANRKALLVSLNQLIDWEKQTEALNHTDLRYGYGRVDAVGHIFNRILLFGGASQPTPNAADAPVSYPHLWNITKQTQLQWDGIAQTAKLNGVAAFDYGALGRNTGEVLGVFGEAVIKPPSGPLDLSGFVSSADVVNLNEMELMLTRLQPPAWPAARFGKAGDIELSDVAGHKLSPDQVVQAGSALFQTNCAQCHTPHEHYETMRTFAQMGDENQTDEWMACNTWAYTGNTGRLAGIPASYVTGDKLPANAPVRAMLETTVKGALLGKKPELAKTALQTIFGITPLPTVLAPRFAVPTPLTPKQQRLKLCQDNAANPLLAYKARPLEGIWATAPYLHNGSVPTLYDLLQPPANRPATFRVGTRAFDPKKVGYQTDPASEGNTFTFETSLPGNSNKGHVYGVGALSETERLELLEYLKTL